MHVIRVGLCEDDAELRCVLGRALGAEGFDVRATATRHGAVKRFSKDPPDVLVLDIGLPDADGRDVWRLIACANRLRAIDGLPASRRPHDRGCTLATRVVSGEVQRAPDEVQAALHLHFMRLAAAAGCGDPVRASSHLGTRKSRCTPREFAGGAAALASGDGGN